MDNMDTNVLIYITIVIGVIGGLVGYWLTRPKRPQRTPKKNAGDAVEKKENEQRGEVITSTSGSGSTVSSKRQAKSKKRREAQQEFTHSWMVGALKGHTASVLDMDFSANNKFLASCAEDSNATSKEHLEGRGDPGKSKVKSVPASPSSSSTKSNSSTGKEQRAILSRRQRKNRTRRNEDDRPPPTIQPAPPKPSPAEPKPKVKANPKEPRKNIPKVEDTKMINTKLIARPRQLQQLNDAAIVSLLRRYTLTGDQLAQLGYPVEFAHFPGYAVILNYQQHARRHYLDANAREFVPGSWPSVVQDSDSGHASATSSLESSDQESNSDTERPSIVTSYTERRCARCTKQFYVSREDGEYLHEEKCWYHWGKLRSGVATHETWECCRGRESAKGCTTARAHVWTGLVPGWYNGPYHDYAKTLPARHVPRDGNYGVYALDCEMCFTTRGLELGRVTVVSLDGQVVYEALVKPDVEVIDYNTRFSGLRAKDLAKATKSLRDVQKDLTDFIYAETILVGHGLENDLRALRILHPTVVDTCIAFPHFLGYPYRNSLKTLARTVLRREIQVKEHDSAEDARIAVDLMLKRLQHDFF